jgi:ATP-binding cassette subfamily F protein 3
MLAKLERVEAVRADRSSGDFRLQAIERTGNHVLSVNETTIGYADKVLASDISFILRRGECLGIIGPNGSGKTTFLKTILGKIPPLSGEVRWGTKVQIGYYAQQLDDLDDRNEIIMELRRVAPASATAGELRGFLGKFHFSGDDVYKHVGDLSGGEKGRLALAKLIYSRVNVLVLDEPTNHLDIPSREALEEALGAYEGTIVTISHDRYFLDRVATQILALDGDGGAEHYDGDYTEYHDWKASRRSAGDPMSRPRIALAESSGDAEATNAAAKQDKGRAVGQKEKRKTALAKPRVKTGVKTGVKPGVKIVKKQAERRNQALIEAEIAAAEKKLNEVTEQMAQPEVAREANRLLALTEEYERAESRLRELYEEWERPSTETANA